MHLGNNVSSFVQCNWDTHNKQAVEKVFTACFPLLSLARKAGEKLKEGSQLLCRVLSPNSQEMAVGNPFSTHC